MSSNEVPFRSPDPILARVAQAAPPPYLALSPDGRHLLEVARAGLPPLADLATPMWRLAGRRLNPDNCAPHGPRSFVGLALCDVESGERRELPLPNDLPLGNFLWSPDQKRFAVTLIGDHAVELWGGDVEGDRLHRLTERPLNAAGRQPVSYLPDGRRLLVRTIPKGRGPAPERSPVPSGPNVQASSGVVSQVRTFVDLLKDPHDELLYDYMLRTQVVLVDPDSGEERELGPPALYRRFSPSPDGRWLLVSRVERPYSYRLPDAYFPETFELWNLEGECVRELLRRPLLEDIPIGGVPRGPRQLGWQTTAPSTLVWMEALDDGDPKKEVPERDRLMCWSAPFEGEAREITRIEHRCVDVEWLEGSSRGLLSEYDRDRYWYRSWLLDVDSGERRALWDLSVRDAYQDPGRPLTVAHPSGRSVIRVDEGRLYLSGGGASPDGSRPFLDRLDLATLETERLWECEAGTFEFVLGLRGSDREFLTLHESPDQPPSYRLRTLPGGAPTILVQHPDPAPEFQGVRKEIVKYTRNDGVDLSGTLYLPPGYEEGKRLPLVMWAYPEEYADADTAGQVTSSPYRFVRPAGASPLLFLLQGYAVLLDAAMPVVGDPETVNDTFVDQIVASADAAIAHLAERGIADPERVGIAGHSYGATMTATLLLHCDSFRAGIARSGAYNRTLTPFGFQRERRTLWEAQPSYLAMSPLLHADRVGKPLLLIHGELDPNPGTQPMQSERYYDALKGHGATVRLVMLPHEGHGYRAFESVLHVIAEMVDWFDRYVKNA
ncbi:MAG: prolyl oligopeptidase family serine peptidase [Planctomycetota bacterium]